MGNLDILKKSFITSTTGECESCLVLKQEGESSSVWPNLAKFRHHGKILQTFDKCMTVHFFGKMLKPTRANLLHYWANFYCCKWPNLKNNLTILVTLVLFILMSARLLHLPPGSVTRCWNKSRPIFFKSLKKCGHSSFYLKRYLFHKPK